MEAEKEIKICGYQVVRKPPQNFDDDGQGIFGNSAPHIDGTYYGGIYRQGWRSIYEEYYSGKLSKKISDTIRDIKNDNNDYTGIDLVINLETALDLLEYSNRLEGRDEIITIYSAKIESIKGAFVPDHSIHWDGFDVVDLGSNSLLLEGIFCDPEVFGDFVTSVNSSGLLDDEEVGRRLIEQYESAAESGQAEELSGLEEELGASYGVDFIWIGRLD